MSRDNQLRRNVSSPSTFESPRRLNRSLRLTHAERICPPATRSVDGDCSLGSLRLSELAREEGLNPTMLSRIVGKLEAAGLVTRTCDSHDARVIHLAATQEGIALRERFAVSAPTRCCTPCAPLQGREATLSAATPALEAIVASSGSATNERQSIGASNVSSLSTTTTASISFGQTTSLVARDADDGPVVVGLHLDSLGDGNRSRRGPPDAARPPPRSYGEWSRPRRQAKLMIILQSAMGVQAAILAVLSLTHVVNYVDVAFWRWCWD